MLGASAHACVYAASQARSTPPRCPSDPVNQAPTEVATSGRPAAFASERTKEDFPSPGAEVRATCRSSLWNAVVPPEARQVASSSMRRVPQACASP